MTGKADLVMWAKNGERFLPRVLKRIEELIPHEEINQKILVDDHSTDNTVKIAKQFNWSVYTNPSTGIPSGAKEAKAWLNKIPKHLLNEKVAAASDIRVVNQPTALRKLEKHRKILREKISVPNVG